MGVHVPGSGNPYPQIGRQFGQEPVAASIAAPVGAVDLDRKPVAPEHAPQLPGDPSASRRFLAHLPGDRTVAGATREAVQAVGVLSDLIERYPRTRRSSWWAAVISRHRFR